MSSSSTLSAEQKKYLQLLAEKYPTIQEVYTEIINLQAILNLRKATEHFMSDLHGEYESFYHILNNCSGVVREKVDLCFEQTLSVEERAELCTLIYYPKRKLEIIEKNGQTTYDWYRTTLDRLIELAKRLSSKYTRSKVRKAMPKAYSYIIDELLHAQQDEDNNQIVYHEKIIDTLITLGSGNEFIIALAGLIKRLAVDHLHIIGDIFDRGARPDAILDMLMQHHSLDIQWGNHDILWMGAAAGSEACIANVVRNSLKYHNTDVLEKGYAISLRPLTLFANKTYPDCSNPLNAALKAISIILFKLEGHVIMRNPDFKMTDRLMLNKIDHVSCTVNVDGIAYPLNNIYLPTVNDEDPYALTDEETHIMKELRLSFQESERLHRHIRFLYQKGSVYLCFNQNLLYHGCIPLNEDGSFLDVTFDGKTYRGKNYMDYVDQMVRQAYFDKKNQRCLDFIWYLWCGCDSPFSGRIMKTFERMMIENEAAWVEKENPYYKYCNDEKTCTMILNEFGLSNEFSHIINGHVPVKVVKGENPAKANGRLLVIDGGFCRAYQKKTGIAGYTLIYNSRGLRIMSHQPFTSIQQSLEENLDIESKSSLIETRTSRLMVMHTDTGAKIKTQICDLKLLLAAYKEGIFVPVK